MKTKPANSPNLDSLKRERRLARYCATGVGAAVCVGAVTTADASIVFIDFGGVVLTDTSPGSGAFTTRPFDLNGDGVFDFQLAVGNGEPFGGAAAILAPNGGTLGVIGFSNNGYRYGSKLVNGANIGPGAGFLNLFAGTANEIASLAFGPGYPGSQWLVSTPGYLGISFTISGQNVYGWVRISVAPNTEPGARNITLFDAAFETNGTAISAGQVPEPSTISLGLLALGIAGLAAHRRLVARKAA